MRLARDFGNRRVWPDAEPIVEFVQIPAVFLLAVGPVTRQLAFPVWLNLRLPVLRPIGFCSWACRIPGDRVMHDSCIGSQSTRRSLKPAADRGLMRLHDAYPSAALHHALPMMQSRRHSISFGRCVALDSVTCRRSSSADCAVRPEACPAPRARMEHREGATPAPSEATRSARRLTPYVPCDAPRQARSSETARRAPSHAYRSQAATMRPSLRRYRGAGRSSEAHAALCRSRPLRSGSPSRRPRSTE